MPGLPHTCLMKTRTVRDLSAADLSGRRALVRVDFNVPLDESGNVSDDTRTLTTAALHGLRRIHRDGYAYKKCGVMLMELQDGQHRQETLFDDPQARIRSARVMRALDSVNSMWGRGTLRTAASGVTQRRAMRSENRSPRYTTHWRELPIVR